MAIHNIKFDGHQRKLIVDYSYTKQVPFTDKRYDFELGREIEFRNHKAEKAKGTYEIAYSVASELNLIEVEALQKVCEGEMPIKCTNQAFNIFGVSNSVCPINSAIKQNKCIYRGDKCRVCLDD